MVGHNKNDVKSIDLLCSILRLKEVKEEKSTMEDYSHVYNANGEEEEEELCAWTRSVARQLIPFLGL